MSEHSATVHVRRQRLVDAAGASAIVLAVAPAGWGKSGFLIDWGAARTGPVLRIAVDRTLSDPDALLQGLARAAARALPGTAVRWYDRAEPDGRPAAARLHTLLDRVPPGSSIIVDDAHGIDADGPAAGLLALLASTAREGHLRLALASRSAVPCIEARDLVHGTAFRIDATQLAMDAAEIAQFFAGTAAAGDAEFLAHAATLTAGWPAGLRMLRGHLGHGDPARALALARATPDALAEYFDREILDRLTHEHRNLLMDLALAERIEPALTDALGAGHDAITLLRAMAAAGEFVRAVDDGFTLHPMLREHLRERALASAPARAADVLAGIASVHVRDGRYLEAIETATQALVLAPAAELVAAGIIEQAAPRIVEAGRPEVLRRVRARIPEAALSARPYLSRLLAWLDDDPAAAPPIADTAPAAAEARCLDHVLTAMRALRAGDIAACADAALAARDAAPRDDPFLRNHVVAVLQAAFRFGGDARVGAAAVEEAAWVAEQVQRPAAAVQAGAMHGNLLIMHGRLHAAEEAIQRALAIAAARLDPAAPAHALAHQFMGYVLYAWNRLDEAVHHLEKARAIAEPLAHRGILTGSLRVLAIVHLRRGERADADAVIDALVRFMERPGLDARNREWLDGVRAAFSVAAGETGGLEAWIARRGYVPDAIARAPAARLHARLQEYATLTDALLLLGRFESARALACALAGAAAAAGRRGFHAAACAAQAAALEALGRSAEADAALADALCIGSPGNMVRAIADTPGALAQVLARARPNGVPFDYLEAVRRCTGTAVRPAGLTDRECDVLALLADGRSNKALARTMGVSLSTVKTHLHNAYRKLGARSRTHALARARDLGLLETAGGGEPAR